MANVYKTFNYTMIFGSNTFTNCNGVVEYRTSEGKKEELFKLERRDSALLLSTSIHDDNGKLIGKIVRNAFVFVEKGYDAQRDYETKKAPNKLTIIRKKDGKEIFSAEIRDRNIVVVNGEFFIGGKRIEATDEKLNLGTHILRKNTIDSCGIGILI